MADPCLLIGDIGGTNARFALAHANESAFTSELTLQCKEYQTAELAITEYLERSSTHQPDVICLATAGPVINNRVQFTNNNWSLDCRELNNSFPGSKSLLLNDFEAIAYSIPLLVGDDLKTVGLTPGGLAGKADYTVGVLGSGTGLGVAGLICRGGQVFPIVSEGGHEGFAPENQLQLQVVMQLRERFERVSNERLLSGPGLEDIYWAMCRIHEEQCGRLAAAEIFQRAKDNDDLNAARALQLFYEALGQVAGNLALTLGASDGIYIAGGIVKRYPDLLKTSSFRSGFENKGRHRSLMERIPTLLIQHDQPGLMGAGHCARTLYHG